MAYDSARQQLHIRNGCALSSRPKYSESKVKKRMACYCLKINKKITFLCPFQTLIGVTLTDSMVVVHYKEKEWQFIQVS